MCCELANIWTLRGGGSFRVYFYSHRFLVRITFRRKKKKPDHNNHFTSSSLQLSHLMQYICMARETKRASVLEKDIIKVFNFGSVVETWFLLSISSTLSLRVSLPLLNAERRDLPVAKDYAMSNGYGSKLQSSMCIRISSCTQCVLEIMHRRCRRLNVSLEAFTDRASKRLKCFARERKEREREMPYSYLVNGKLPTKKLVFFQVWFD